MNKEEFIRDSNAVILMLMHANALGSLPEKVYGKSAFTHAEWDEAMAAFNRIQRAAKETLENP